MLAGASFTLIRGVGKTLPLSLTAALLWAWTAFRLLPAVVLRRAGNPPLELPPSGRPAGFATSLAARGRVKVNHRALLLTDEFNSARWASRLALSEIDGLKEIARDRPVIVASFHYGVYNLLPAMLRSRGLPTVTLMSQRYWPVEKWRLRSANLTRVGDYEPYLRAGDARGALRYLTAGHCLFVSLDHVLGEQVLVPYRGGALKLSTAPLRLARLAHAVVVPMLASSEGTWRFRVTMGASVPDELIQAGDERAALSHIVEQLLPIAAGRPQQALPLFVRAFAGGAREA